MPRSTERFEKASIRIEKDFTILDAAHPVGHVTMQFHDSATHLGVKKRLTFHHESYMVDVSFAIEGVTESYDIGLGTNFGIVEWGDGFIGLIGSASRVDDKIEKETPENELERKGTVQWVALQDKYFLSVLMPKEGSCRARQEGRRKNCVGWGADARARSSHLGCASAVCRPEGIRHAPLVERGPGRHDRFRMVHFRQLDCCESRSPSRSFMCCDSSMSIRITMGSPSSC